MADLRPISPLTAMENVAARTNVMEALRAE
jgi:hypothetical protein